MMALKIINSVLFALAPVFLLSLPLASAIAAVAPPRISVEDLRSALSSPPDQRSGINLHRILHDSHGILRIAVGNSDYDAVSRGNSGFSKLRKRALRHLCDCPTFRSSGPSSTATGYDDGSITFEEALESHPKDVQQITLPDGTVRRTLASATIGFDESDADRYAAATALELPSWVQDTCGRDAYNSFEDLRDAVADVVDMFVRRLDQEKISSKERAHIISNEGMAGQSYRQILSDANHLEHFHVYTKPIQSGGEGKGERVAEKHGGNHSNDNENGSIGDHSLHKETPTLDYHTDAGFFLSFVPAMDCQSYTTDSSSFFLKGRTKPLIFEKDEIVIMMGAGAQYWLPWHGENVHGSEDQGKQSFLAASHALLLPQDTHRAWYGKMHLVPSSFTSRKTDRDVKLGQALNSFQLEDYDAHVPASPVDGCGTNIFNDNYADSIVTFPHNAVGQKQSRRRRLQHVNSPANCNNQTNFFCWHQCVDMPESENAEAYVQDGYSLYCLDPALLASSNSIQEATAPCERGYAHNSKCTGNWQKTDARVLGYELPYEVKNETRDQAGQSLIYPTPDIENRYCYGGTSMHMNGFEWHGTTCVIYLFQSWVLTTPGKFALAAIGSIIFGIALEFVLWKRRSVYALSPGLHRLCLSAIVYGLQLTMGYFIMLVIMTYSGPLFISTVCGMMLGHTAFNAQDALVKRWDEKKNKLDTDAQAATCEGNGALPETTRAGSGTKLSSYQNGTGLGSFQNEDDSQLENGDCCRPAKSPPISAGEGTRLRGAVADGATPCCQYTL